MDKYGHRRHFPYADGVGEDYFDCRAKRRRIPANTKGTRCFFDYQSQKASRADSEATRALTLPQFHCAPPTAMRHYTAQQGAALSPIPNLKYFAPRPPVYHRPYEYRRLYWAADYHDASYFHAMMALFVEEDASERHAERLLSADESGVTPCPRRFSQRCTSSVSMSLYAGDSPAEASFKMASRY